LRRQHDHFPIVILSEVTDARNASVTQSKDSLHTYSARNRAGNS
jgi:hypothetical protein